MWGFEISVMLAMIAVNSVFAAYEIALASVTAARLQRLVEEKRPGAKVALWMKQNIEASLAVVQLGITLVGAIAAAVGGAGAEEKISPLLISRFGISDDAAEALSIILIVIPLTFVTILFGELIPKVFALRRAESLCLRLSPPMRVFSLCVWPAVRLFEIIVTGILRWGESRLGSHSLDQDKVALQELRTGAALARASRLIGAREEEIILGATKLRIRKAADILLPADSISALDANASLAENLIAAHLDMHTRFPVWETVGDPQTIIGYVNVKDILAALKSDHGKPSIRSIIRPILSVRDTQTLAECLERLLHEHTHIALVRDEKDHVTGMISLEDILEELVGEIRDEYDRLPAYVTAAGTGWVIGGGTPLPRVKELSGIDFAELPVNAPCTTIADWVDAHLARAPHGGEILEPGANLRIVVRKIRRSRVQEAFVTRLA